MSFVNVLTVFTFLLRLSEVIGTTPVVLWHGVGDDHLETIKKAIRENVNGEVFIKSIQLGMTAIEDIGSGIFVHPNVQIAAVCDEIMADEKLRDGFNAIGFSQGAQFLRGLIQRCAGAKVVNFISLGGQHQGIFGIPTCSAERHVICKFYRTVLNYFAYTHWAQNTIAQATFWHDPLHEEKYRTRSTFLADINNERNINQNYIRRLQRLNKFVMVKFTRDQIITPLDTAWFGFFQPGSDAIVLSLENSEIYHNDRLGLKQMNKDEKLVFIEVDNEHVSFSEEWFAAKILIPFLNT